MGYKVTIGTRQKSAVCVVGCGGTGSFISEGLCRILPPEMPLLLIDHDRVEPRNLKRQNFYIGDLAKFKAQALGERLSRLYRRGVAYSVLPYKRDLLHTRLPGIGYSMNAALIIGCVDNVSARHRLSELQYDDWWIDSGNSYQSGQVLIGNTTSKDLLKNCFDEGLQLVNRLPAPNIQLPGLMAPNVTPEPSRSCAEAVESEDQSPVINQIMANLVLDMVYKLLRGELSIMGAYIDLESGTLSTVPADPVTVARMISVKVDTLMVSKKSIKIHK